MIDKLKGNVKIFHTKWASYGFLAWVDIYLPTVGFVWTCIKNEGRKCQWRKIHNGPCLKRQ